MRYLRTMVFFLSLINVPAGIYADGSKDLYPDGVRGKRAYLFSRTATVSKGASLNHSWPFRTYGDHFVYLNIGETIAMASSAHGLGNTSAGTALLAGRIRLTRPDGQVLTFNYNESTGAGRIPDRTSELAGPRFPNQASGGNRYLPHFHTADMAGVWKVEFFPVYDLDPNGSYIPLLNTAYDYNADGTWRQPRDYTAADYARGQDIAAWDVSVWGTDGNWKRGRVYTTVMNLSIVDDFNTSSGFYGKIYPLTKDGWVYEVDNNGQVGAYFTFFVNNKGFYRSETDRLPRYKSLNLSDTAGVQPLIHDPRKADVGTDVTCKMFYTRPDPTMPATGNVFLEGQMRQTWLMNTRTPPEINDLVLVGVEGTDGQASQKGGYIRFNASVAGIFRINFVASGHQERVITGIAAQGINSIFWDGKDGAGVSLPNGITPANVSVQLFGAEVHFPYIDKEINPNGVLIRRLDDASANANVVYWDDIDITGGLPATRSNPTTNLQGLSSTLNGHKWGTNTTGKGSLPTGANNQTYNGDVGLYSFGNGRSMDTWAYIPSNIAEETVDLQVLSVDLGVDNFSNSLPGATTTVRPGDTLTYSVDVFNTGGSSTADGALFQLHLPIGIAVDESAVTVAVIAGGGTEVAGSRAFDPATGRFSVSVNMPAGARMRYTIPVSVLSQAVPGSDVNAWATVLRPADVYDINATNMAPHSDGTPILPTDPFFECQGPAPNTAPGSSQPYNPGSGDPIPCNNLAFNAGPAVLATPTITLAKTVTNATPIEKAGDVINYRFEVANPGNVNLTAVVLSDAMPGLSPLAGPVHHVGNGDNVLNQGEVWRYTATYTVTAADITQGILTNNATVQAVPTTGGTVSETASVAVEIQSADVRIEKSVDNTVPRVNSMVTFTLIIANAGPADATDVRVLDQVPNGYAEVSGITGGGLLTGSEIAWSGLTIPSGQQLTLSYQVRVLRGGAGISHLNTATVSVDGLYDPDTENNSATSSVTPKAGLSITNPMLRQRTKKQ